MEIICEFGEVVMLCKDCVLRVSIFTATTTFQKEGWCESAAL